MDISFNEYVISDNKERLNVETIHGFLSRSLGKKLIETIMNYEKFKGLTSFLGTLDAHGLYEQFGFVKDENRFMKRPPIA
jgi:hypothetical protein